MNLLWKVDTLPTTKVVGMTVTVEGIFPFIHCLSTQSLIKDVALCQMSDISHYKLLLLVSLSRERLVAKWELIKCSHDGKRRRNLGECMTRRKLCFVTYSLLPSLCYSGPILFSYTADIPYTESVPQFSDHICFQWDSLVLPCTINRFCWMESNL